MSIKVSAVQLGWAFASTPQEFADRVREPIEKAAQDGAQIIALPNYTGWMLLGVMVPAAQEDRSVEQAAREGGYASAREMLVGAGATLRDFYHHLFGSLAERLGVYLAPGTITELSGEMFCNTAYVFGPDGKTVGFQRQTHRTPAEVGWGLMQGDELQVLDVGIARLGLVVGTDVAYPEVSRILALQGANLLIHNAAFQGWNEEHFLVDLWSQVQANQVFGLQACLVGNRFRGQSAIYAPVEMTRENRGILAQASESATEEIVTASLDFSALQKVIDDYPIFDYLNYEFYAKAFPSAYGREGNGH